MSIKDPAERKEAGASSEEGMGDFLLLLLLLLENRFIITPRCIGNRHKFAQIR